MNSVVSYLSVSKSGVCYRPPLLIVTTQSTALLLRLVMPVLGVFDVNKLAHFRNSNHRQEANEQEEER